MRKALIYLTFFILSVVAFPSGAQNAVVDSLGIPRDRWVHKDGEFLRQLQQRDSILIGDQLEYGFRLNDVADGTILGFPKLEDSYLELIEDWTQKVEPIKDKPGYMDLEASITIAAFEEGEYTLPPIIIGSVTPDGKVDTLFFDPIKIQVKTIQLDTATFQPHPMKEMIQTPFNWDEFVFTVKELWTAFLALLPGLLIGKWVIIAIVVGVCIWLIRKRKNAGDAYLAPSAGEPAHIVALRKLDAFRSNALWVPEKQKDFYSGVTDTLREYISRRYGVGAMEMTTAELFDAAESVEGFPVDQLGELKDLFQTADFVKFAKFVASDEESASAVPKAVRFVTMTYQSELEKQQAKDIEEREDNKK